MSLTGLTNEMIAQCVRDVLLEVVEARWADLGGRFEQRGVSAEDIARDVSSYGLLFCSPPPDFMAVATVVPIVGSATPAVSVVAPLWTSTGRSDLCVDCTIELRDNVCKTLLNGIYVP